jgi:hypothetical protein
MGERKGVVLRALRERGWGTHTREGAQQKGGGREEEEMRWGVSVSVSQRCVGEGGGVSCLFIGRRRPKETTGEEQDRITAVFVITR